MGLHFIAIATTSVVIAGVMRMKLQCRTSGKRYVFQSQPRVGEGRRIDAGRARTSWI